MDTVAAQPGLKITAAAWSRVQQLMREQDKPAMKMRVSVEGGGCSGFQYDFRFEEAPDADDFVLDRDGAELLVDPLSMQYLEGAELDCVEELAGTRFVIRNPNARTTCGCGSSFTA